MQYIPSLMTNVVFLCMQNHFYLAIVCCLRIHRNLCLVELIRDGIIRNRNLLALIR